MNQYTYSTIGYHVDTLENNLLALTIEHTHSGQAAVQLQHSVRRNVKTPLDKNRTCWSEPGVKTQGWQLEE